MTPHERRLAGFILALTLLPNVVRAQTVAAHGMREPKAESGPVAAADPLLNGALIGASIGAGLAMWDYLIDPSEPGNAAIFAVAIGLGTAIGAGIDALVNTRTASPRQTAGVTVSPLLGKDQQGVLVSIRF